jgi:hypothetical protein
MKLECTKMKAAEAQLQENLDAQNVTQAAGQIDQSRMTGIATWTQPQVHHSRHH